MEQFKLKSIEEFDRAFVAARKAQQQAAQPVIPAPAVPAIPMEEISSGATETEIDFAQETPQAARPLVPIGQKNAIYSPVGMDALDTEDTVPPLHEEDFDPKKHKKAQKAQARAEGKMSPGLLAGKIATIVVLCITVVFFLFGCFVSIFLDNNGADIGGYCFSTMSQDIDSLGGVSEGDLIVSKKTDGAEYAIGDVIAVPATNAMGCDLQYINGIQQTGAERQFSTVSANGGYGASQFVPESACLGHVSFYVPKLAKIINVATADTLQKIFTCVFFVLIAGVCCTLLVVIENANRKAKRRKS